MDEKKIATIILGATIISVVCINWKFNRRTQALADLAMTQAQIIDDQFQREVDEIFTDIVNHYDE